MRWQSCGIALSAAAAAFAFAFTSPAHADFFTASCSGGGTSITCTFNATSGNLLIDGSAADVNLSGSVTGGTETFSGGTATSSTVDFTSNNNVNGFGRFTVTDNLSSAGTPGNPTASTITLTITGTNLALSPNADGNTFAAHICQGASAGGTACASTFFAVPGPIVGAGLPGLMMACGGLVALARRRRQKIV